MLVGIWLGLYWVLFSFFDHYIQSSVRWGKTKAAAVYLKKSVTARGDRFGLSLLRGVFFEDVEDRLLVRGVLLRCCEEDEECWEDRAYSRRKRGREREGKKGRGAHSH